MAVCIPKDISEKLRKAIKSKEINIDDLYNKSGIEARAMFEKYVGKENAKLVNAEYEKARLIAEKRSAVDYITYSDKKGFAKLATKGEFSKKLLTSEESKQFSLNKLDEKIKKSQEQQAKTIDKIKTATGEDKANLQFKLNKFKDVEDRLNVRKEDINNPVTDKLVKKINSLKGRLDDTHYSELVSAKMGHDISPAQSKYIIDKAIELKELAKENKNDSGGLTAEYDNARNSLNSYISHLDTNNVTAIIQDMSDWGRNMLISGLSTPIKVLSNYMNFFGRKVLQRITHLSLRGENVDLIKSLEKDDKKFMKETGSSRVQFSNMNDTSTVLGNHPGIRSNDSENYGAPSVNANEIGVSGKIAKGTRFARNISHNIAIKLEHTLAYNYVFRKTFYDTMKFSARDIAKFEKVPKSEIASRSAEIIKDANLVEPKTDAGKALRLHAQKTAAFVTNTNKNIAEATAMKIKSAFNEAVPGLHFGDLIMPMVKIPVNVIVNGLHNTALFGAPLYVRDIIRGRQMMFSDMPMETRLKGLARYQKGLQGIAGVIGTQALGLMIVNGMKPKDFKMDRWGNTYVHVFGLWVNTEYFSRVAPTIGGMMAEKVAKGKGFTAQIVAYGTGTARSLIRMPFGAMSSTLEAVTSKPGHFIADFGITRGAPAGVLNLFKSRPTNRVLFGAHGVETDKMVAQDKTDIARRRWLKRHGQ